MQRHTVALCTYLIYWFLPPCLTNSNSIGYGSISRSFYHVLYRARSFYYCEEVLCLTKRFVGYSVFRKPMWFKKQDAYRLLPLLLIKPCISTEFVRSKLERNHAVNQNPQITDFASTLIKYYIRTKEYPNEPDTFQRPAHQLVFDLIFGVGFKMKNRDLVNEFVSERVN